MKPMLIAVLATVPVLAQAQERIPAAVSRASHDQCMPACEAENSYAFCAAACGCMVDQMRRHWTMDDLKVRGDRLAADPNSPAIRAEMGRLAAYCAGRTAGSRQRSDAD